MTTTITEKHVGKQNKDIARQNILRKQSILNGWKKGIPWRTDEQGNPVRDADGELMVDFYPRSLREFCAWDGTQNSLQVRKAFYHPGENESTPPFKTTGFDTLSRQNADLKKQIEQDIELLKQQEKRQLLETNKTAVVNQLQAELDWYKASLKAHETKYVQLTQQILELQLELTKEKRGHKEDTNQLKDEISRLSAINADLTATINKIHVLRSTGGNGER